MLRFGVACTAAWRKERSKGGERYSFLSIISGYPKLLREHSHKLSGLFSLLAMNIDPTFKQILDEIPERDQEALVQQHSITNFAELIAKRDNLQQRQLKDVCSEVQMVLEVACVYVESLDPSASFTWEGFQNFCDYNDNSGVLDDGDDLNDDQTKNKKRQPEKYSDPEGYSLTAEERKQMDLNVENDPLTMKIRGFSPRSLHFESDEHNKKKIVEDSSEKSEVAFNGNVYFSRKCYFYQQPSSGEKVIVAIRKFTKVTTMFDRCIC